MYGVEIPDENYGSSRPGRTSSRLGQGRRSDNIPRLEVQEDAAEALDALAVASCEGQVTDVHFPLGIRQYGCPFYVCGSSNDGPVFIKVWRADQKSTDRDLIDSENLAASTCEGVRCIEPRRG
jgi:hypothetical protein